MTRPTRDGDLGDLLVLMLNAHRSFDTLQAELRVWRHTERSAEAFRRQREGRRGTSQLVSFGAGPSDPEPPESEDRLRIWLARPDRRREEWAGAVGGVRTEHTLVEVGASWWSLDEHGAHSNNGDPEMLHGSRIDAALLDPAQLLACRDLELAGRARQAGRDAIRVLSRPSPRDAFLPDTFRPLDDAWPRELLVDAERGVLLRSISLLDGEPFALTEVVGIVFDEPIPEERFVFEPPAGVSVRDVRGRFDALRPMSLEEAAREAPFTVFAVAGVRGDWTMRVHSVSGDAGYGWPPSVLVHYANELSSINININQHAAGDEGLAATAPDGSEWRVEQLEHGELRLWEPSERERGMPRMGLTVIGGTRIQISTADLDLDEIAGLAERLVPAPSGPPASS